MLVLWRAMEPPLEVRGQQGVHGGAIAGAQGLVQPENQELVPLLRGLPLIRIELELGGEALQLIRVSQLLLS